MLQVVEIAVVSVAVTTPAGVLAGDSDAPVLGRTVVRHGEPQISVLICDAPHQRVNRLLLRGHFLQGLVCLSLRNLTGPDVGQQVNGLLHNA